MSKGVSIPEMMEDPELRSKIHFLIEKQAQEMKLYMIDHKIKLEPGMFVFMTEFSVFTLIDTIANDNC